MNLSGIGEAQREATGQRNKLEDSALLQERTTQGRTTKKEMKPVRMENARDRRIRILLAKVGLDGHDRGVKIVARALRDAGMEVIYTGLHRTAEEVVESAIQEDVNIIGISVLSGAHMTIFPRVLSLLKERQADDILVIGGGTILPEDREALRKQGVAEIWSPGTHTGEIIEYIRKALS